MTTFRNTLLSLAIVALAQTAALAYMVADRVHLLNSVLSLPLPILPVDPRDLFRGEYVRLGYPVSTVPVRLLEGSPPRGNSPFYVVLEKSPGGIWQPLKVSTGAMPKETSP